MLPQRYKDALTGRQRSVIQASSPPPSPVMNPLSRRIKDWYSAVLEASLSAEQQQRLQHIVQVKFQVRWRWLDEGLRE